MPGDDQDKEKKKKLKEEKRYRTWATRLTWVGTFAWLALLIGDPAKGSLAFNILGMGGLLSFIIAIVFYVKEYRRRTEILEEGEGNPSGGVFIVTLLVLIFSAVLVTLLLYAN